MSPKPHEPNGDKEPEPIDGTPVKPPFPTKPIQPPPDKGGQK